MDANEEIRAERIARKVGRIERARKGTLYYAVNVFVDLYSGNLVLDDHDTEAEALAALIDSLEDGGDYASKAYLHTLIYSASGLQVAKLWDVAVARVLPEAA